MSRRTLPIAVPILTALLALVGFATAILAGTDGPTTAWWVLVPLVVVMVVAGWLQLHFHYRGHVVAMDLFEAALLPVVLIIPGLGAVLLAVFAKAMSQRLRRVEAAKATFNTAQWAAATGTASLVYVGLGGTGLDGARQTAAVMVGMVAGMLVNHLSVALVLGFVHNLSISETLTSLKPLVVPIWLIGGVVNLTFGVMSAAVVTSQPIFAPLLLVPVAVLHWAQRAYAETRADRARLEALHAATQALAAPVDPADAVAPFLDLVRRCFETAAVDLVFLDRLDDVRHSGQPGTEPLSRRIASELAMRVVEPRGAQRAAARDGSALGDLLLSAGHQNCLIAPLQASGTMTGVLIAFERAGLEGFEAGEVAVFEALAAELADALHKSDLLSALMRERA